MAPTDLIAIAPGVSLDLRDVTFSAIRAQGAGGQNVNKVASAIHLRFDIDAASLPEWVKRRLRESGDSRISDDGVLVIKAQNHRTQARNREEAMARLIEVLRAATQVRKARRATRPTRASQERRITSKKKLSKNKQLRRKPPID